ncbi:hypothetical protein FXO38_17665 [Capsicum annuum]|nr:hypothetical protein FXO37_22667 [Capsicum annuum]KAF3649422.1 hypothetical protein FXO38_17665 [Capsicum annuum]
MPLPQVSNEKDKPVWSLNSNATFSTSTLVSGTRPVKYPDQRFNLVWKAIAPNKDPSKPGHLKLNTDESVAANLSADGLGEAFRYHIGNWVLRYYQHMLHTTPTMAKLLALRQGLTIATTRNIKPLLIKTNLAAIIYILTNDHPFYHNIIIGCRTLLVEIEVAPPTQILREQNAVVDLLAKTGTKTTFMATRLTLSTMSSFVIDCVVIDSSGTLFKPTVRNSATILSGWDVALNSLIFAPTSDRSTKPYLF